MRFGPGRFGMAIRFGPGRRFGTAGKFGAAAKLGAAMEFWLCTGTFVPRMGAVSCASLQLAALPVTSTGY
jgi:hypothetical protein